MEVSNTLVTATIIVLVLYMFLLACALSWTNTACRFLTALLQRPVEAMDVVRWQAALKRGETITFQIFRDK
jgi:hypothetical protein